MRLFLWLVSWLVLHGFKESSDPKMKRCWQVLIGSAMMSHVRAWDRKKRGVILILSLFKILLLILHSSLISLHLLLFSTALHSNPTSFNSWTLGHPLTQGFPGGSDSKESACNAGDLSLVPGLGGSLGEGNGWLFTPVFLPGESHGQRSLVGYSPWGYKELDTTEQLTLSLFSLLMLNRRGAGSLDQEHPQTSTH